MNINSASSIDALVTKASLTQARKDREEPSAAAISPVAGNSATSRVAGSDEAGSSAGAPPALPDIAGLILDWGQSGSPHDLDGNGTVDVDDLIAMVEQWQGSPVEAPQGTVNPSDVFGVISAWGQSNSEFDLNQDGIVDNDDLILALQGNQPHVGGTEPDVAPPAHAATEPLGARKLTKDEVASLAAARATTDPVALSAAEVDAVTPGAAPATGADADTVGPAGAPNASDPNTIYGVLGAWNQQGSGYDLNGDGSVNVDDMIAAIQQAAAAQAAGNVQPPPGEQEQNPTISDALTRRAQRSRGDINKPLKIDIEKPNMAAHTEKPLTRDAAKSERSDGSQGRPTLAAGHLKKLSESLVDRLLAAGFTHRPPGNLREIVNKLNLAPGDQSHLMQRLQDAYPGGLGVNLRV